MSKKYESTLPPDSYEQLVEQEQDSALIEAVETILRLGVYSMDLRRRVDEIIDQEESE